MFYSAKNSRGLTLIELIVTITIIAITFMLLGSRLGISAFWNEESFLRKLRETITFLHQQAVVDQTYYRMDFNFDTHSYKVSAISSVNSEVNQDEQLIASGTGYLSNELSLILSPALGRDYQLIPPPSFPSMANEVPLPESLSFSMLKTQRGEFTGQQQEQSYILFSPRGFSEFAAIYLNHGEFGKITILINPFSGNTELFREEKEFNWNFNQTSDEQNR